MQHVVPRSTSYILSIMSQNLDKAVAKEMKEMAKSIFKV